MNVRDLAASKTADEKQKVFMNADKLGSDIEHLPVSKAGEILSRIKLKVVVSENGIGGSFEPAEALGILISDEATARSNFKIALDRQSYGHEPRLRLQPSGEDRTAKNDKLVELLSRAFAAREQLLQMDEAAARAIKTTKLRHLQRLARLSYLDPSIIRSILNGSQPTSLRARSLWRMGDLPIRFADQREALGFSNS